MDDPGFPILTALVLVPVIGAVLVILTPKPAARRSSSSWGSSPPSSRSR